MPEDIIDSRTCGLTDAVQSGWFQNATGELLTGFRIDAEHTVLDAGCGDGAATLFAARRGARVIFTDIEARSIETLKQRVADTPARDPLGLVSDSQQLPLPDAVTDRIISTEMLEHVDDPAQALRELARVGRSGAQYLITVPDACGEHLQQKLAPASHFEKPNHIHIFSREDFESLVTNAGLVIESRHHTGFFWILWMCLFWANPKKLDSDATLDLVHPPYAPVLDQWAKTWDILIHMPEGERVKRVLDEYLPKRQVILARKP